MRVFVVSTDYCGDVTFAKACAHATNYTAGHQTGLRNHYSLTYPDDHIEVDSRLAWFLGPLAESYPREVYWVHLCRDALATARSFERHGDMGILAAYRHGIKGGACDCVPREARSLLRTVTANIRVFLARQAHATIFIERAREEFPAIWKAIGAAGDLAAALQEFDASDYHLLTTRHSPLTTP